MRPIGRIVCCFIAISAVGIQAQENELRYSAPTIHNSGQRSGAAPLQPLAGPNAPLPNHPSNASWVGGQSSGVPTNQPQNNVGNSQFQPNGLAQATYTPALPNATQPTAAQASVESNAQTPRTRTPLNPRKSEAPADTKQSSSGNTLKMMFSVGSSLLIVIGLFLGVAWCYRKTLNTSMGSIPKQVVSILGRTAIAPRQQLVLVRFGSKLVLVSLIQGEARTISEIIDPLEVDQLAGACESHQPHSLTNSFRSLLNQNGGGAA